MTTGAPTYDLVIPTLGRPSLAALLRSLAAGTALPAGRVLLVDDRPDTSGPLDTGAVDPRLSARVEVLRGRSAGPAAARNVGWRAAGAEWVAFVDDDVEVPPTWVRDLEADLATCQPDVAGTQGGIRVPLTQDRRPTDWERNVAGLERARWATADLAYRRSVLAQLGGFDERFPRAYREDADLGLRVVAAGHRIERGRRHVVHPVRPAPWHVSIGKQAGNIDDALMDRLHGRGWREAAGAPRGARRGHAITTAAGAGALAAALARRPGLARVAALLWAARTAAFAARRIAPGPRTVQEIGAMALTSVVVPPAATAAYLRGVLRARRLTAGPVPSPTAVAPEPRLADAGTATPPATEPRRPAAAPAVEAVLFDRDGTLVVDVPYNGDPDQVQPVPEARAALDRLRAAGLPVAIVSNQSGVARGLLDMAQVEAVNRRVQELLGPFAAVLVCPHGPDDGCRDRKPGPGLVERAAAALGVPVERCALIGDIGSDVEAALAAGARPILVPTPVTRADEVAAAPAVAPDLHAAVELVLSGRTGA